jgi:hypothetical protein
MNYRLAAAIRDLEREVCEPFEGEQKPVWIVERATQRLRAENERLALERADPVEAMLTTRRRIISQ